MILWFGGEGALFRNGSPSSQPHQWEKSTPPFLAQSFIVGSSGAFLKRLRFTAGGSLRVPKLPSSGVCACVSWIGVWRPAPLGSPDVSVPRRAAHGTVDSV